MMTTTSARQRFERAADGRDFTVYTRAMSAATDAKAEQMFPHLIIPENGRILDVGSGTGDLAGLAAHEFAPAEVYALDLSHELLEIADEQRTQFELVYGDARRQHFPDSYFDGIYSSTMGHEVVSFGSRDDLTDLLRARLNELKPGGCYVHRDFVLPALEGDVYLQLIEPDGEIDFVSPDALPEAIDYEHLTTRALFFEFARQFEGGNVPFAIEQIDGIDYIKLSARHAYEFISRKDYRANFLNEIKETYGYWTPEQGREALEKSGFINVKAIPEYHRWIVPKRWQDRVALAVKDDQGRLQPLPFDPTFPTHMTWVAYKPDDTSTTIADEVHPGVRYGQLMESITLDVSSGSVSIGEKSFRIDPTPLETGTKRVVYNLRDTPNAVLKLPRRDGLNLHNRFKAMYQTVARSEVLDAYEVPHAAVLDADPEGPPFRYVIQERLPDESIAASDLIQHGELTETDIQQMASIINRFEQRKEWQLDTNPYNWFRVTLPDGSTQMTYADGKVYQYDEQWSFGRVGLIQWLLPELLGSPDGTACAVVPTEQLIQNTDIWWDPSRKEVSWWKNHLHPSLCP